MVIQWLRCDRRYDLISALYPNSYSVTFKNEDGTILDQQNNIPYLSEITYKGATPIKPNPEDGYVYTFSGWDKSLVVTEGDMIFVAQYSKTKANYFVQYLDYDDSLLYKVTTNNKTDAFVYLDEKPSRFPSNNLQYCFKLWGKIKDSGGEIIYKVLMIAVTLV